MAPQTCLPTKVLGGVAVPFTPLIQKALAFAKQTSSMDVYNHVVRSFLFGFLIADRIDALRTRDQEVHALAAILHDLGLPMGRTIVDSGRSHDKRFEVDGANAARDFVMKEVKDTEEWSVHRLQLLWDAIALHSTSSIALHKEPEVQACCWGIRADFLGPDRLPPQMLSWQDFDQCVEHYPRLGIAGGFKNNMLALCCEKPATTHDNTTGEWGKKYLSYQDYVPLSGQKLLEQSLIDLDLRSS